jgi:riboflavin kinase / FMN adenylyltransferase
MRVFKSLENLPKFKNAVITIGTFDGVHLGHQKLIERINQIAATHQGESVVITFHPHPRFVVNPDDKSLKLINTLEEKIQLLGKYKIDNLVVVPFTLAFSQQAAIEYVKNFLVGNFKPSTIVIGYDHHFGQNRSGNISLLKEYATIFGYKVEEISKEMLEDIDISSTKIRKALADGNVKIAGELMGHYYFLTGFVVKGDQNGRKIGFPTANIQLPVHYKLIPKNGVYAVKVKINQSLYCGMLNIGYRPTFEGANKSIEVHVFDFNQDIYGEEIQVKFVDYLREEKKFDSLEALKKQLTEDAIAAKKILQIN